LISIQNHEFVTHEIIVLRYGPLVIVVSDQRRIVAKFTPTFEIIDKTTCHFWNEK